PASYPLSLHGRSSDLCRIAKTFTSNPCHPCVVRRMCSLSALSVPPELLPRKGPSPATTPRRFQQVATCAQPTHNTSSILTPTTRSEEHTSDSSHQIIS